MYMNALCQTLGDALLIVLIDNPDWNILRIYKLVIHVTYTVSCTCIDGFY